MYLFHCSGHLKQFVRVLTCMVAV